MILAGWWRMVAVDGADCWLVVCQPRVEYQQSVVRSHNLLCM
jgi:hypothetical protein